MQSRFLDIIRENENVIEGKLKTAWQQRQRTNEHILEVVIDLQVLPRRPATRYYAESLGVPFKELFTESVNPEAVQLLDKNFAEENKVVAYDLDEDGSLHIACYDSGDIKLLAKIRNKTRRNVVPCIADLENISQVLGEIYDESEAFDRGIEKNIAAAQAGVLAKGEIDPPFIRLVDLFIKKGIAEKATDIHFSPDTKATHIAYRLDGIMMPAYVLPKELHTSLVTRIKVLAGLNIAEQRKAQDGGINFSYSGRTVDIRVSTSPTDVGENAVLRLLDSGSVVMGLENLGFSRKDHDAIMALSEKPHGIVLSAGPTGSGKTTTLYSILGSLDALERNILTIEDPIEYRVPYIKQSQVNVKAGHTFAAAIRTFLRQDPDVILVGEIRDLETAHIAFQAAMTGHLVFSTVHTNDAASSIARLLDLGVEPYLIPSCLRAVMAQRLVRRVCTRCCEEYYFTEDEISLYGLLSYGISSELRGRGCQYCAERGYKGRIGIIEILHVSPNVSKLILEKTSSDQIEYVARSEGMVTMREDGLDKVKRGITTVSEVLRVTG
jgi:type II secretory ATPase GspE/PulE/Tfp pilus assembly ATPase PilB-like protein